MGKRAQPQRHGELLAILVRKPSWIGAARVRDNETNVQVASRVGQSSDESLVREIGNDDAMLHPEIPRELGAECLEQGLPSTLACIAHSSFARSWGSNLSRVAYEAAISSLRPGRRPDPALYIVIDTKIPCLRGFVK